jgi:hypothetical protein
MAAAVSLLAGFAAGHWSMAGISASAARSRDGKPIAALPTPPAPPGAPSTPGAAQGIGVAKDREPGIEGQIAWERKLLLTPVTEFPALFEECLKNSRSVDSMMRLLQLWADRDPAGFIAWGKHQPQYRRMQSAENSVGIGDVVMKTAIRQDPDEAWELAGKLHGLPDSHRWNILTTLVENDPAVATAFLAKHRDVFSASHQAYGHWLIMNPMKMLPLLDHLDAGPAKNDLVKQSARYYLENAGEEAAAEAWFASLPPDLQEQAANKARARIFIEWSPRGWKPFSASGEPMRPPPKPKAVSEAIKGGFTQNAAETILTDNPAFRWEVGERYPLAQRRWSPLPAPSALPEAGNSADVTGPHPTNCSRLR